MQAWSPVQTSSSTPKRSLDHALAVLDRLVEQRLHAALLVQHAFGGGDDDLGAFLLGRQRFLQRVAHLADIVGAVDLADPLAADALHRLDDRIVGARAGLLVARDDRMS